MIHANTRCACKAYVHSNNYRNRITYACMCALCALTFLYLCVKCLFNHKIVCWRSTNEIRPKSCELLLAISNCLSFLFFFCEFFSCVFYEIAPLYSTISHTLVSILVFLHLMFHGLVFWLFVCLFNGLCICAVSTRRYGCMSCFFSLPKTHPCVHKYIPIYLFKICETCVSSPILMQ